MPLNIKKTTPYDGTKGFKSKGTGGSFSVIPELVTTGLVLRYDIFEPQSYSGAGSTVTDLQGNSNATLVNSPTYSNKSITFNGSNQYLLTSTNLASQVPSDVTTLSMWAYPMDNGVLLTELGSSSLNAGWHDSQMEMVGGTMKFRMWPAGGITSSISTPLNAWYNFTIVFDGYTLWTYINGQPAGNANFSRDTPVESSSTLYYGIAGEDITNMGDGTYANMKLGQFLVYNTALTSKQVVQNYKATKNLYGL